MSTRTDVILVVKGAGKQDEDVHLNQFLRGFWPAINSLDKNATISQIPLGIDNGVSSPHNEKNGSHKHITEIRAKLPDSKDKADKYVNKRIWIKESYWEYEVLPSGALGNLLKEWQMSSHVFANMFQDIFFSRDSKEARKRRETKDALAKTTYPDTRKIDVFGNYVSYMLLFLLLFLPLGVDSLLGGSPSVFESFLGELNGVYSVMAFVFCLAAIWAIAPAYEIYTKVSRRKEEGLKILPGLPAWSLVLLIFLVLSSPAGYFVVLFVSLLLQIAQLISRSILWKYRKYANSDVDGASYYQYEHETKGTVIGKVQESWYTRLAFSPLIYRYFIFLALPVAFIITVFASILKWTKVFGGIGENLDNFVKFLLVGYLDDVVNYAKDPAQAHRVRSVVMEDIKYFHNLDEVQRIHVVAHSQGTPITFEALFHFLEPQYQQKIYTYVTLGSILSYYYQSRGTLDLVYNNRFQMPVRETDNFPREFKWMNFWNFTDPITEFYGLDEYAWFNSEWKVDPETKKRLAVRGYTSPVNIRTRSSLWKNHGEYWDNLDKLQIPFAKRVLGKNRPDEWNPDVVGEKNWHHLAVLLLWPVIILLILSVGYGIYWLAQNFLSGYFEQIIFGIENIRANLFPPDLENPSLLTKLSDPLTFPILKTTWREILSLSLILLSIWAVFDWFSQWINQLRRTLKFGRK